MSADLYYRNNNEVYQNGNPSLMSGTLLGYGDQEDGRIFPTLAEYQAHTVARETFRQNSVLVKNQASQNLRDQFETLLAGSSERLDQVEFMVITETGEITFYGNRTAAQDFASSSNKVCAIGEIRGFQVIDLPEAELAVRVAAL